MSINASTDWRHNHSRNVIKDERCELNERMEIANDLFPGMREDIFPRKSELMHFLQKDGNPKNDCISHTVDGFW